LVWISSNTTPSNSIAARHAGKQDMPERTSRSADADHDHQKTEADCVSYRPSKFQITASAAMSSTNMMMRRPMWFTRHRPFLLFAFVKPFHNRRSPWYQHSLIRKPLRKVGVILLHDVEHRFLGEPAMVLGK
jgi:hypothetical protein